MSLLTSCSWCVASLENVSKVVATKKFENHCSAVSGSLLVQIVKTKFFVSDLGLSVRDVTMGHVFVSFGLRLPGPVRQSNEPFLWLKFCGISVIIRVFRVLDWLASISAAKITVPQKKQKLAKILLPPTLTLGIIYHKWP